MPKLAQILLTEQPMSADTTNEEAVLEHSLHQLVELPRISRHLVTRALQWSFNSRCLRLFAPGYSGTD